MLIRIFKTQLFLLILITSSCTSLNKPETNVSVKELDAIIDKWHLAASNANYDGYFGRMADDAIYIGTDASERWTKKEFSTFAKPYFDKGKAWDFKAIKRNWRTEALNIIWFDETLETWMGTCRSTGILMKYNNEWLIQHYQLSVTVPNEKIKPFINLIKDETIDSNN